ncbi:MAG TPA: DNA methyltransferase [Gemmataceae bacterium]|nr:DNA methyltransferase [Gemmataceae bacterium]
MRKKSAPAARSQPDSADLFAKPEDRRRRALFLPRFLAEEAKSNLLRGKKQDRAQEILRKWADMESKGHLDKKETALDADFLQKVFGEALGYQSLTQGPENYQLERNFTVPGIGTADGALGLFGSKNASSPLAVIELKGAKVDLDRDKSNGRTAVQQCWDYLNALPECPWGIVSNFAATRLYHRDSTPLAYQEFQLKDIARNDEVFRQFYCLFEIGGLLPSPLGEPRALKLLNKTAHRQREVGDELYSTYNDQRWRLIEHLHRQQGQSLDEAIRIAQVLLDRIIFVAFCEDRGLLPEKCIETAYNTLPPFSKVTNPRWQNFLALFHAVDKGHSRDLRLDNGYNGGLFRHDPAVDDLQLDDEWTHFFRTVGSYDFRDEVNVEVLGHIFEKSIGELEGLRASALFASSGPAAPGNGAQPVMPKSPERKRFGIYYTPPEFTRFIVHNTLNAVIEERFERLRKERGLTADDLNSDRPAPKLAEYWPACRDALRQIKVCDPACGSGAFLVQAYELLEEHYLRLADGLRLHDEAAAHALEESAPDLILADNLYGVDLSQQAVEITQLALWIRSARHSRTLADLSHNIVWGNSLVADHNVHPKALEWPAAFPTVFHRQGGGFDCVIGNPPWERLKLQEREFFAFAAPNIANAVSAADRRRLTAKLENSDPELFARYTAALAAADRTLSHVRSSGDYPLTARGDINTYMLFAELARKLLAPSGRAGLLVPSGIATDKTTRDFFNELMESKSLIKLYDFENRQLIFPDVDGRFKFCVLVFGGSEIKKSAADFVFFAHSMNDLKPKNRHIALSSADLALLNPNTRTCPIFRSRRDAELTKDVYRRVPILIDEARREGGNPWGIRFVRMIDQTNDAELFHDAAQLKEMGCRRAGNRWTLGQRTFLPLYEAKMVQAYDHRAASVKLAEGNWVRQGQTEDTTLVEHQNPEFVVQPRWWVEESEVVRVGGVAAKQPAYLCFKDVTSPTNQRTMIAALIPPVAVVNSAPLMIHGEDISPRALGCLLANLNSFALDFVARQKVGGLHLNFFIVNQLPLFPPVEYAKKCPWDKRSTLESWISQRVLKLTCTANDMKPFAAAADFDPPVHRWDAEERTELLAELDAAFFVLYGIGRADVEYILGTFAGLRSQESALPGFRSTTVRILEAYDRLCNYI